MIINSFRSGFLELLSSCVDHILYFDDFHSTPHSLTPSQSVQQSPKWDTNAEIVTLFPKPTPHLPTPAKPKTYYAKKKSNSVSLLFAFLLMNSQEKTSSKPRLN